MVVMPVVLVDDEPQVRKVIKAALSKRGLSVVEATDGLDALSVIDKLEGKISALVTDVEMPNLDGLMLCRKVKERFPRLPVLLMSASPVAEECQICDAFLQKPFGPDLLLKLLSNLCAPLAS